MRSTPTRRALTAVVAAALAGALGTSTAAASDPTLEKAVEQLAPTAAQPYTRVAPEATPLAASADASNDGWEWTLFQKINVDRIAWSAPPVIRHGSLDAVAGQWATTQAAAGTFDLDPQVETKIPAGSHGGIELLYWSAGTDVQYFLEQVAAAVEVDGLYDNFTDSGIAVVQGGGYLYAYVLLAEYAHSTPQPGELPLYRFYKPSSGTHFYSTSAGERNNVIVYPDYRYEGLVAYIKTPTSTGSGLRDLNRFYLRSAGTHFYTSSPAEYQAVRTYPQYSLDGVAGRVHSAAGSGLTAMHRFFRPSSGTHFYTANASEVESVKKIPGYRYEGIAFYLRVAG